MKITTIIFSIFLSGTLSLSLNKNQFKELEIKFNSLAQQNPRMRRMNHAEKEYRQALFFESVAQIEESNTHLDDGRPKLEINSFSLLNSKEKQKFLGFKSDLKKPKKKVKLTHDSLRNVPKKIIGKRTLDRKAQVSSQRTKSLQYFTVTEANLNEHELNWVNYWENEFLFLDGYLQQWYDQVIADCTYYIGLYGTEDFVRDFCNEYYYQSVLPTHQQNIASWFAYMDDDYNYYTVAYRTYFERLIQYYPTFRANIESGEGSYQESVTTEFEQFMQTFNPNQPSSNDPVDPPADNTDQSTNNTDTSSSSSNPTTIQEAVQAGIIPQSIDWIANGMVSPVKNQGQCGSCWAFSTHAMLESMHLMQKGNLINLSEQQLINCSQQNGGCSGGLMSKALEFILNNKTTFESEIPYLEKNDTCPNTIQNSYNIQSIDHLRVAQNMLEFLKVLKERPVTIAYYVSDNFYNLGYDQIIRYNESTICPNGQGVPNHGVQAVGYYVDPNDINNIWINFKNSWGHQWGTDGFFKIGIDNDLSTYKNGSKCHMLKYYDEITWAVVAQQFNYILFYFNLFQFILIYFLLMIYFIKSIQKIQLILFNIFVINQQSIIGSQLFIKSFAY